MDLRPDKTIGYFIASLSIISIGIFVVVISGRVDINLSKSQAENETFLAEENNILTIDKLGRNVSNNEFADSTSIDAKPGELLEFALRVTNSSSQTINNIVVEDVLPSYLHYVQDSLVIGGRSLDEDIQSGGVHISAITSGETITIRFQVQVAEKDVFATGTTNFFNSASVDSKVSTPQTDHLPISVSVSRELTTAQIGANSFFVSFGLAIFVSLIIFFVTSSVSISTTTQQGTVVPVSKRSGTKKRVLIWTLFILLSFILIYSIRSSFI